MGRIGGQELLIVLLIVVLIFGARKLPELARSLGSSAKEFRKGIEEGSAEDDDASKANSVDSDATESQSSESRETPDP